MDRKRLLRSPLLWIAAVLLLILAFNWLSNDTRAYKEIDTSVALEQLNSGNVKEVEFQDKEQRLLLTLDDGKQVEGASQLQSRFPAESSDEIVTALEEADISDSWNTKVNQQSLFVQILVYLIPLGLLLLLLMWMMNNAQGGGNRVLNFGKSRAKQLSKDMPKTTFSDVAGAEEAVEELEEIKDFLQNPGRYQALG